MIHQTIRLALLACTCLSTVVALRAENWGQWRGPTFNGATTE
jgi:hypothetical protein